MAYTKRITTKSTTGATVYAIITRMADGYRLNDATGSFSSGPADPYVAMTEDATELGVYVLSENRSAWTDGRYRVTTYKQSGGSESPSADAPPIDAYEVVLSGDQVVGDDTLNAFGIYLRASVSGMAKSIAEIIKTLQELVKQIKISNAYTSSTDKANRRN